MREIECRGKRLSNQAWVYGSYYEHQPPPVGLIPKDYVPEEPEHYIIQSGFADWNLPRPIYCIKVDVSTVGQYTGLKDKNGKKIFEGDIIKVTGEFAIDDYGIVKWSQQEDDYTYHCGFMVDWQEEVKRRSHLSFWANHREIEIIGNIYEGDDLLGEKR